MLLILPLCLLFLLEVKILNLSHFILELKFSNTVSLTLHLLKIFISYKFPVATKDRASLHYVQGELQDLPYKMSCYFLLIIKHYVQTEPSDLLQKT